MFYRSARVVVLFVCLCGVLSAAESGGVWLDVPFIKQEQNGCGAASVAMVMQYWLKQQGRSASASADAAQIHRSLYVAGSQGVYTSALERYFQDHGFRTFSFSGEWNDFQQHLQKGRPLIVALKPSGGDGSLHYVVVAGLDSAMGIVLLNDPARRKLLKQDRDDFEKQWSATGKWTLLALPQPADGG
jgi:ABC-type bacteriocin/lantibiotic exporter with double-glycine peptidase domain